MMRIAVLPLALLLALGGVRAQDAGTAANPVREPKKDTQTALESLKLPGIWINLAECCVDVTSEICLDEGMLELVACTRDSKEHESIVVAEAKAMHIHTALLLLGGRSGNPAMRKRVGDKEKRWVDVPPQGGRIDVYLVIETEEGKPIERPISDFIAPADPAVAESESKKTKKEQFPTHTFLVAGSHLVTEGAGPRTYLGDRSGSVMSIATFGDEMLCLPGVHGHAKGALLGQADPKHLPPVGSKVTLRLRPEAATSAPRKGDSEDSGSEGQRKN